MRIGEREAADRGVESGASQYPAERSSQYAAQIVIGGERCEQHRREQEGHRWYHRIHREPQVISPQQLDQHVSDEARIDDAFATQRQPLIHRQVQQQQEGHDDGESSRMKGLHRDVQRRCKRCDRGEPERGRMAEDAAQPHLHRGRVAELLLRSDAHEVAGRRVAERTVRCCRSASKQSAKRSIACSLSSRFQSL